MFDPKKLISPFQSAVNAVDAKDPIYKLLIDKYNIVVNKVNHQNKLTNTLATCTQIDANTGKPFTREIEYDRLDIGSWSEQNTKEYRDKLGIRRRLLISGSVNKTTADVTVPALTKALYNDHGILVSEADLTYGKDRTYTTTDTEFGKAYHLVNCTTYRNVVTYTGGDVIVNHLNVGRKTLLSYDSDLRSGFKLLRTNQPGETLQLKLPVVGTADKWTVLIEGVDNIVNTTPGTLWSKIELSDTGEYWIVYDNDDTLGVFDATKVNLLTFESVEGVMSVKGNSVNGDVQELQFEPQESVDEHIFQRITAYSNNPFAITFQFEMSSSEVEVPVEVDVNLAVNNTIYAHPLSNALTGRIDAPLTLSDLRAVNYKEVGQDTYKPPATEKFEYGYVDRVITMKTSEELTSEIKIVDLPNLIRTNKISKLTFKIHSFEKNGLEYGTYVYEIVSVDSDNDTMHTITSYRGNILEENETAPIPSVDTFSCTTSFQTARISFNSLSRSLGYPLNDTPEVVYMQQNLKVGVHMKGKQVLPEIVYTKSTANLIIT